MLVGVCVGKVKNWFLQTDGGLQFTTADFKEPEKNPKQLNLRHLELVDLVKNIYS